MKITEFLSNFIKHPGCVGAIAPSTENLAVQMVAPVDLKNVENRYEEEKMINSFIAFQLMFLILDELNDENMVYC